MELSVSRWSAGLAIVEIMWYVCPGCQNEHCPLGGK